MTIVDIHPHVISKDTSKYPLNPVGGKQSGWSKDRPVDAEELVDAMDEAGIDRAVVVQAATAYFDDNRYLADSMEKYGERFAAGVCTVDLLADNAVDRIKYWVGERNFSAVRLFTAGSTMPENKVASWLNDERCFVAFAYLAENQIPTHFAMQPESLPLVHNIMRRFPDLSLVLDNAAHAWILSEGPSYEQAEAFFDLSSYPRAHVKVISSTLRETEAKPGGSLAFLNALIEHFGSERLMWGSNFPASEGSLSNLTELATKCFAPLSETDRTNIFGRGAQRLYLHR